MTESRTPYVGEADPPAPMTMFERMCKAAWDAREDALHRHFAFLSAYPRREWANADEAKFKSEVWIMIYAALIEMRTPTRPMADAIEDAISETLERDETHTFPSDAAPATVLVAVVEAILAGAPRGNAKP